MKISVQIQNDFLDSENKNLTYIINWGKKLATFHDGRGWMKEYELNHHTVNMRSYEQTFQNPTFQIW